MHPATQYACISIKESRLKIPLAHIQDPLRMDVTIRTTIAEEGVKD